MAQQKSGSLVNKLLFTGQHNSRLWTALSALCIGTTLLLLSVLIWWNFNQLLNGKHDGDSLGSTFLTLSKRVSNENMGQAGATLFSAADIAGLKQVKEVQDVGHLLAVKDKVNMRIQMGANLNFSTIMFLESVPDNFMDRLPPDWNWRPGNVQVPIILSSEFLSLYNYVFAPSQGLPQLSEASIKALPFKLELGNDGEEEVYIAHVAGFSDRITSVLVPEAFAQYANQRSGIAAAPPPSRLVVKVSDPSSKTFVQYLSDHDYVTNSEQLRWSRLRAVVQVVAGATGILALLLMGVSVLVFTLFIELTIARARQSVQLLLEIGYSPARLSASLYRRFLPLLSAAFILAVVLAVIAQFVAATYGKQSMLVLSYVPGWPMWLVAVICLIILMLQMKRAVGKALEKI